MADPKPEEQDIIVVGKRNDDSRAVWDRHPFHPSNYGEPKGEVFISDMRPYEVHRSLGIQQKIGERELQELGSMSSKGAQERRSAWEDQQKEQRERRRMLREQAEDAPPGAVNIPLAASLPQETTPQYTTQGGLDASAHPVTAVENEPGGVGSTDPTSDDDPTDEGRRQVRRPARSGDKTDR